MLKLIKLLQAMIITITLLLACGVQAAAPISISATSNPAQQSLNNILFPPINPFHEDYLQVSNLHRIWYAEYGNPKGLPVVVVHGGPGGSAGPNDMRYFDPNDYHVILFEQRGTNRSLPLGELKSNTTADLIADMEKLRNHLGIKQWIVYGGSWGSALSMLYGEEHPDACLGFILRGIFLGTDAEYQQLWYGIQDTFPDEWQQLQSFLPLNERQNVMAAYTHRMLDPDPLISRPAAKQFLHYDFTCSFLQSSPQQIDTLLQDDKLVDGISRIFAFYGSHHFFIKDNQILLNLPKITHLPAIIVHGRYDVITRAKRAYQLHQQWPGSELILVPEAGHAAAEPGNTKALIAATEKMKSMINTVH